MASVLIAGASRGIGLEFVRQYAQAGFSVFATYRSDDTALQALDGDIRLFKADLSDVCDLQALKTAIGDQPIDILIHNAGVYGGNSDDTTDWLRTFHINSITPFNVINAFKDNVASSELKTIAALSSKMASMSDNGSGGSYVYRSSKAALNAIMKSFSLDLAPAGIKTIILHPGWVRTDMTHHNGLIDVEECVSGLRQQLNNTTTADSGLFVDYKGDHIDW